MKNGYNAKMPEGGMPYETQDGRFEYRLLVDGKAEIISGRSRIRVSRHEPGKRNRLCIPAEMDGHPVTGIARGAFSKNLLLQEIVIAHGITCIGEDAFADCMMLERVEIPSSVTQIGEGAFDIARKARKRRQTDWKEDLLEAEKEELGDGHFFLSASVLNYAFSEEMAPMIPDSHRLTLVVEAGSYAQAYAQAHGLYHTRSGCVDGDYAYRLCSDGTAEVMAYLGNGSSEVIIPDRLHGYALSGIAAGAFQGHGEICRVVIPQGVARIGLWAFEGCKALEEIVFRAGLRRIDNAAFSNCAALRLLALPEGLEEMGMFAFEHCERLKYVRIPGSVKHIAENTFEGCRELQIVEIRSGVKGVKAEAFKDCVELRKVTIPASAAFVSRCAFEEDIEDKRREKQEDAQLERGRNVWRF